MSFASKFAASIASLIVGITGFLMLTLGSTSAVADTDWNSVTGTNSVADCDWNNPC
jgi:hypothetical protein